MRFQKAEGPQPQNDSWPDLAQSEMFACCSAPGEQSHSPSLFAREKINTYFNICIVFAVQMQIFVQKHLNDRVQLFHFPELIIFMFITVECLVSFWV